MINLATKNKATPRSYNARLLERRTIADGTLALILERPAGFRFEAGQYTVVSVPHELEAGEEEREFSLASAPYEATLMLAMRLRDTAFKCACNTLKRGEMVELREPAGELTARSGGASEIWLAGGIGVTPLRSIIRESCNNRQPLNVKLFYSARSTKTMPFLNDLKHCAKTSPGFTLYPTLTGPLEANWDGLSGRIDETMIRQQVPEFIDHTYTVVGTRPFVADMILMLKNLGVSPDNIRWERFCGYRRQADVLS